MKNKIIIFDTTLRDGEQSPGCQLNTVEKIEIAQALQELGVDVSQVHFSPFRDYLHEKQMVWRYVYSAEFLLEKSQMTLGEGESFDWVPFDDVSKLDITENTRLDVEYFLRSYRR
jgi:hypothetical protein